MATWANYPYGPPAAECGCEHGDRWDGSAGGPKAADVDCGRKACSGCHEEACCTECDAEPGEDTPRGWLCESCRWERTP